MGINLNILVRSLVSCDIIFKKLTFVVVIDFNHMSAFRRNLELVK